MASAVGIAAFELVLVTTWKVVLGLTATAAALEVATGLELVLELTGSEAATGVELLVPFHTAGPGNGKVLYPL